MFQSAGRNAYSKELSSLGKSAYPPPFNELLVGYSFFERRRFVQYLMRSLMTLYVIMQHLTNENDCKALERWKGSCVLMDEAQVLKHKGNFRWRNLMVVTQHV
jgi:SWI/SNF-related matrix-associated actin-dependent regulator 1 of chromatin subfamily A